MGSPLVSCIMPTYNRRAFVPHAIHYFLQQEYPNKELIIIDDGGDCIEDLIPDNPIVRYYRLPQKITLGAKLNIACAYSKGGIIANWDDDDWYSSWRLTYQVKAMQDRHIYICGINNLLYYDLCHHAAFQYIYPTNQPKWLLGSSLCFRKEFWEKSQFADINVGMDGLFVWSTTQDHVLALSDSTFAVHMIHDKNVSPKKTNGGWWHSYPVAEIEKVMNGDMVYYNEATIASQGIVIPSRANDNFYKPGCAMKNVYACLVHEDPDCIEDLINNLRYFDPDSQIVLYNGGNDANLLDQFIHQEKKRIHICPDPGPVQHGYLHGFALQCMEYSLIHFDFDVLTIVDSDQLCIRDGYTKFLSTYFTGEKLRNVGLLSSSAKQVTKEEEANLVAKQAFREFDLWKPFLGKFQDGENKFVHWTFWPSTVFTVNAIKDLVALFKDDLLLREVMTRTRIWATEEVILPTLVRLLGYEIGSNPCSYDFVQYKKLFTEEEVNEALEQGNAFWLHPVIRRFDDPVRQQIREKFNNYSPVKTDQPETFIDKIELLNKVRRIEGWLSDKEADLLIETMLKTLKRFPSFNNVVEVGSYHGKSTVLFGGVIKSLRSDSKVFAIDPHDGKLGDAEQGLRFYPPSFESFKRNIDNAGLHDIIEIIKDRSVNLRWEQPVSLLFVDGLHDYKNVVADFDHFNKWIRPGGFAAFHDYAYYFPGVKKLVDEILESNAYIKINQADSLIVLQKI
ncbi:MAG TPA: class I SAM-dependent methyltransferase [Chitinophagaceae bacterium]|nr:class I SAM-dependent methyltransferase [Chitinophagaceae bacterium]